MTREELLPLVQKYATVHGLDPGLVMKMIETESNFDPQALSPVGAQGLMQLMPATATGLGVIDSFDPEQNVSGGTKYLAQLVKQFPDLRKAVAAYNFGPGNVSKGRPLPVETVNYVDKVLGPAADEPDFGDVLGTVSTDSAITPETRRAKIISDPDFAKFDSATQARILGKLVGDSNPGPMIGPGRGIPEEASTMPEAFERIMESSGISGVMDRLLGKVPSVLPAPPSPVQTVAERPLDETDAAAGIRGVLTAAMPMAAPALLPVGALGGAVGASPGVVASAIRAGTAGIGETQTVPALLRMLGLGAAGGAGLGWAGREVGEEVGLPELGALAGETVGGITPFLRTPQSSSTLAQGLAKRLLAGAMRGKVPATSEMAPAATAPIDLFEAIRVAAADQAARAATAAEREALADRGPVRGRVQVEEPVGERLVRTPQEVAVEGQATTLVQPPLPQGGPIVPATGIAGRRVPVSKTPGAGLVLPGDVAASEQAVMGARKNVQSSRVAGEQLADVQELEPGRSPVTAPVEMPTTAKKAAAAAKFAEAPRFRDVETGEVVVYYNGHLTPEESNNVITGVRRATTKTIAKELRDGTLEPVEPVAKEALDSGVPAGDNRPVEDPLAALEASLAARPVPIEPEVTSPTLKAKLDADPDLRRKFYDERERINPGNADLATPIDRIPAGIERDLAESLINARYKRWADNPGSIPTREAFATTLPEELQPHANVVYDEALDRASGRIGGARTLHVLREAHPGALPDGVHQMPDTTPGTYDIVQVEGGKIVAGAVVKDNSLSMIAGGREYGGPSIKPVRALLEKNGVERNNVMTTPGMRSRARLLKDLEGRYERGDSEAVGGDGRQDGGPAPQEGMAGVSGRAAEVGAEVPVAPTRPEVAPSQAASGGSPVKTPVQVPESGLTARIGGREYHAGEVVEDGPHAGKTVVSVEEGGVPVLSRPKVKAPQAASGEIPVKTPVQAAPETPAPVEVTTVPTQKKVQKVYDAAYDAAVEEGKTHEEASALAARAARGDAVLRGLRVQTTEPVRPKVGIPEQSGQKVLSALKVGERPAARTPDTMRRAWEEDGTVPPEFVASFKKENKGAEPTPEQTKEQLPGWFAKMGAGRRPGGAAPSSPKGPAAPKYSISPNELGFYSQVERVVSDPKTQATQRGADWAKFLTDPKRGVKADEMKWTGLDDFLAERGDKKVTREEVLAYLKENQIEVREVILGGGVKEYSAKNLPPGWKIEEGKGHGVTMAGDDTEELGWDLTIPDQGTYRVNDSRGRIIRNREEANKIIEDEVLSEHVEQPPDATKYGNSPDLQEPGGTNYREVLLTLPQKTPVEKSGWWVTDNDTGEIVQQFKTKKEAWDWANNQPPDSREYLVSQGDISGTGPEFRAGHFSDKAPNVLAHVRVNDRTSADGKKVLFIEELQSDWAQKGRREGFKGDKQSLPAGHKIIDMGDAKVNHRFNVFTEGGLLLGEGETREAAIANALKRHPQDNKVPAAPFVEKTEDWTALALKRVVRYAAENGYDRVAWTTGDQQAARYDLSKQVESIAWTKNGDKPEPTFDLEILTKDGQMSDSLLPRGLKSKDLVEHIGKELTDKILKAAEDGVEDGLFEGIDLKVGGEGMRGFYDKIVPQVAEKIGKKWGVKVSSSDVGTNEELVFRPHGPEAYQEYRVKSPDGLETMAIFPKDKGWEYHLWGKKGRDQSNVLKAGTLEQAKKEALTLFDDRTGLLKVHSVDVTPEMRASVMSEGFPQFAVNRKVLPKDGGAVNAGVISPLDGVVEATWSAKEVQKGQYIHRLFMNPEMVERVNATEGTTSKHVSDPVLRFHISKDGRIEIPALDNNSWASPPEKMLREHYSRQFTQQQLRDKVAEQLGLKPGYSTGDGSSAPVTLEAVQRNLPETLRNKVQEIDGAFHVATPRGHVTIRPTGDVELNWHALELGHGEEGAAAVRAGAHRVIGSTSTVGRDAVVQIVDAGALPHEVGHVFLDHFATPKEYATIMASLQKKADAEGRSLDEVFSDGYSDWFKHDRDIRENEGLLASVYRRVHEFFAGVYRTFKPDLGGTYRDVARGKVFDRPEAVVPPSKKSPVDLLAALKVRTLEK